MNQTVEICLTVLFFPIIMAFMMIFMVIWLLFTITGIGPALQYCYTQKDKKLLDRDNLINNQQSRDGMQLITIPAGVHSCTDGPYKVFAIFQQPELRTNKPFVCIPNGLGATAVIIASMQESLVNAGYAVLSFDRLGVGLSDVNSTGRIPSAMDVVNEMHYVMQSIESQCRASHNEEIQWILLGPSMGSIVAQCYLAVHPQRCVGFLNMDGLPYTFHPFRAQFTSAGSIYKMYSSIIWTGALRPFIGMMRSHLDKLFHNRLFSIDIILAQFNQSNFYFNVSLEMITMMNCCDFANAAWQGLAVNDMPQPQLNFLIRYPPKESLILDDETNERRVTNYRSISEFESEWCNDEQKHMVEETLRQRANHKVCFIAECLFLVFVLL